MVIELEQKKEDQEKVVDPAVSKEEEVVEEQKPVEDDQDEKFRKLELENAELRGRQLEREKTVIPAQPQLDPQEQQYNQTKQVLMGDSRTLDAEAFEEKYKMSKDEARSHMFDYELQMEKGKNAENMAVLRAENQLAKKYGDKYSKYQDEIDESLRDLSASVKQDPKKLQIHIERTIKAAIADEKPEIKSQPKKKDDGMSDRKITNSGFQKPGVVPDPASSDDGANKNDEIAEPNRKLAAVFGIESESERKKLKESPFVEMDFGNGTIFRDPDKGFEKKKN